MTVTAPGHENTGAVASNGPSGGTAPVLAVRDVSVAFGGVRAVDGMSLSLEGGGRLGVIGPNGAGKTTLFNLLAGDLRPDAGEIRLDGVSVHREGAHRRTARGLARTFQIPRPFAAMSVRENFLAAGQNQVGEGVLTNFLSFRRVAASERTLSRRADELLDFLSLARLADEPARFLSGGQRKLLELGRALMAEPRVLLLDEPAAGVNPALLDLLIDRLEAISQRGVALLLIEHNMEMVRRLCSRVLVMAGGRRLAEGSPDAVTRDPAVVDAYLGGAPA